MDSQPAVGGKSWGNLLLGELASAWRSIRTNPYGWIVVVIAAFAMVATLPGRTYGLGMITERLLADPAFGLDRVSYADMNLWATLLGGLFCLPCGYLIDRFGLKINLTVTVVALGLVVIGMTRLNGWWPLFIALVLTRGFGQSALSVISITMVGKWFKGPMTLPMAVYTLLLSMGFAYSFQLAKPYAAPMDWREIWGGMGWLLLLVMTPLALLLPRERIVPRAADAKLGLDGQGPDATKAETGFTLFQAMCTPTFWVFGLSISVIALIGSGNSLFNESVLKQQGFSTAVYYNLATLTGTVALIFKLPVGWIGQRCPLNMMNAVGLFILAACLFWFPFVRTETTITLYGILMGVSGSITTILFFSIWGQAYGRAHLGLIQSVAQMMTVLASALGPKVFAECFDRFGSYVPAFQILAGIVALLAVWSLLVRVPSPEDAAQFVDTPRGLTAAQEPC
ncbi:MAG TPA: MFS transporter [Schlesneria sp.]|jgi:MFS family permease